MNLIKNMVEIHQKLIKINQNLTFVGPILSSEFKSDQFGMTNWSSDFELDGPIQFGSHNRPSLTYLSL